MKSFSSFFFCPAFLIFLFVQTGRTQISADLYALADSTQNFSDLVYFGDVDPHWVKDTSILWYRVNTRRGTEYFLVKPDILSKETAFDLERLTDSLHTQVLDTLDPFDLPLRDLEFSTSLDTITFILNHAKWNCDLSDLNTSMPVRTAHSHQNHSVPISCHIPDWLNSDLSLYSWMAWVRPTGQKNFTMSAGKT